MRWLVALGFVFAALSGPASAADLGGDNRVSFKDEAPFNPRFNWTGGYIGAQLGYGWADTDASATAPAQTFGYDSNGVVGGLHAGYNFQNQTFVYGVEADIDFADLDGSGLGSAGTLTHQTEVNWIGSLRARLGFAADRTLFYVTGGWAFGEVDVSVTGAAAGSDSETRNGWILGGGVEQAVTNNITARLEYRYVDLGDESFSNTLLSESSDVTVQSLRAGVSWKF